MNFLSAPKQGVKNAMTQNNEIDSKFKSPVYSVTNSFPSFNSPPQSNPKDELLKSDMMKKLSLKEKWLNEQASLKEQKIPPMEVDPSPSNKKKKDEKKSFLTGIFSSVKHLIKPDKEKDKADKHKSNSPLSNESIDLDKILADEKVNVDNFDELVVESDKPVPGCVNMRIQAFLKKQKSDEVREGADDILNDIKEGNDRMAKQMRDMEQRRFSENMNAIKSSVVDSKVASINEMNISKYFPTQLEKKPPAVAKNRDVKALKDVNLSKYFPQSPTSGKKLNGSPTGTSATSSAAASPLMPRKNINEIDLANYFPGTPVMCRKTSVSSPPGSPMTESAPTLERRFSITEHTIPPPPPPPLAKKNILSLQSVKKRQTSNENIDCNLVQSKKEPSPVKSRETSNNSHARKTDKEFNMFDQLLDGALDLKEIDEKMEDELDNFESLIGEDKLERSPSKEYERIFDSRVSKSKNSSKEMLPENVEWKKRQSPEREDDVKEVKKATKKSKSKSPKKVEPPQLFDKLTIDPKIFKNLTKEYQRLVVELERSSKSPEAGEESQQSKKDHISELSPDQLRLDNKRKSPLRFEDCKKFKEESENKNPIEISAADEDSVVARLERKYRRGSLKTVEEMENQQVAQLEVERITEERAAEVEEKPLENYSVIERLEIKLRRKREMAASDLENEENVQLLKDLPKLNSTALVKEQCRKQETPKKEAVNKTLPTKKNAKEFPPSSKLQEATCFETFLSLPKDEACDIFNELAKSKDETDKSFQETFDNITNNEEPRQSKKKVKSKATPEKIKHIESAEILPKENDFGFSFEPKNAVKQEALSCKPKVQPVETKSETNAINLRSYDLKQKRESLKLDLAEIDFGICERPLNLGELFPRQTSIEEIEESPKSTNSNEKLKVISGRDAYSGSQKSSVPEKEIELPLENTKISKPAVSASYINVLKEISSGLIGFDDDEPLIFIAPPKETTKNAVVKVEQFATKENAKQSYTKVLQDISSTLVGLDLYGVEIPKKNYSQIIPPPVQDNQTRAASSSSILEVPDILDFEPDNDEVIDIKIPVAPPRRHRSVESTETPELAIRTRRPLPTSKSFDYETVSGRSSKNSTEYYDHYYPTNSTGRRQDKYDNNTRKESLDEGVRARNRQRAFDDIMLKSTQSRMYEADDVTLRRHRRESSDPADAINLSERSNALHQKKESFMRDQMNESRNPYIREMMRQDVDHPIDISDIKYIRKNPSASLPSNSLSSYQRPAAYVPRPTSYVKPSTFPHTPITTSYSRPTTSYSTSAYKSAPSSALGYLPSSSTAAHILTKSHTMSPTNHTSSYSTRRPITSISDPHTSSSSRFMSQSRPTSYSQKKNSGTNRDACVIS